MSGAFIDFASVLNTKAWNLEPAAATATFDDVAAPNFSGGSFADDVVDFFKAFDIKQTVNNNKWGRLVVLLPPKKERDAALKALRGDRVSIVNSGLYHVVL